MLMRSHSAVLLRQPIPPRRGDLAAGGFPTDPRSGRDRLNGMGLLARGSTRAGRLPEVSDLSGRWPGAPHSQLRDSAGFEPASRVPVSYSLVPSIIARTRTATSPRRRSRPGRRGLNFTSAACREVAPGSLLHLPTAWGGGHGGEAALAGGD